jgi:hypothetical protein
MHMARVLCIFAISLVAWLGAPELHAKLYQVVRVNVVTWEVVEVQGSSILTADRAARVQLVVPIGINKSTLDHLMDLCRKAGVRSFEVAKKD